MRIDSPSFSGSVTQADSAFSELSGSFSGSFSGSVTGSFTGDIDVETATFDDLSVRNTLLVGSDNLNGDTNVINSGSIEVSGSINLTENNSFNVNGVDVLDTALAFSIALG